MSSMLMGNLKISIFGQSHSGGIGVVIDSLPVGEKIDLEDLSRLMSRRAPGQGAHTTSRREADVPEILSGLVDGVTCGAPLCAVIRNANTRSADYDELRRVPRPGHADLTAHVKYHGFQDVAGGGHFSGRLTAPLVFAGGVCMQILSRRGVTIGAHILSVGDVKDSAFDSVSADGAAILLPGLKPFPVIDDAAGIRMQDVIARAKAEGDSVGGVIECKCTGVPAGLGDPMFDGMENRIGRILFAIPAVKGVEFGDGFHAAAMRGSDHNDAYYIEETQIKCATNHAGGILGGITNGMPLLFRCAVKPTPSIARVQHSVDVYAKTSETLEIRGRHDPCIAPRAVPVVESAAAIALLDAWMSQKMDKMG